jgi:hypothetical protein
MKNINFADALIISSANKINCIFPVSSSKQQNRNLEEEKCE